MHRFARNRIATAALAYLLIILVVGVFAPLIAPQDPAAQNGAPFQGLSAQHWLGTDDLGRDIFSRLVFGTRVDLRASVEIVALALVFALPIGLIAGHRGGRLDYAIMRLMDAMSSIPALVLALAIAGALGPGLDNAMIAITIVILPGFVRLVRAQALVVSQEPFIEASRSIGTSTRFVLFRRILPNIASPLIVQVSIALGMAILAEAALSYLGLGILPPGASWGSMLRRGYDFINVDAYQMVPPAVMIALSVIAFNFVGDALRDALGTQVLRPPRRVRVRSHLGVTTVAPGPTPPTRGPAPVLPGLNIAISSAEPTEPFLLSVRDLVVTVDGEHGILDVVDGVSFDVGRGEVVGLVGESGSGKTVTSLAIMRLLPSPPFRVSNGVVRFNGRDIFGLDVRDMRRLRGNEIAMVFQDPMRSLNPAFTIGNQLEEAIKLHADLRGAALTRRAEDLLDMVRIADPKRRLKEYPHQLSGGMRQRVIIAQALSCAPQLLIADEPTTALDVTIQAEILELMKSLQRELKMSVIFVTHDLGVVADICDRVVVMYAGQVIEAASVTEIFAAPSHPYSAALLEAMPQLTEPGEHLASIPGVVPLAGDMPKGCRFGPRCPFAVERCAEVQVPLISVAGAVGGPHREVRCIRYGEIELDVKHAP